MLFRSVNEEGLALFHGLDGFLEASDGGIVSGAVHGNEMGKGKRLADDGIFKERFFEKNGDAAGDGVDHGRGVGGAGVVGYEKAGACGDAFGAEDFNADAYRAAEEHSAAGAGPVESVGTLDEHGEDEERDAYDDDVEREEDGDEECAEHGRF